MRASTDNISYGTVQPVPSIKPTNERAMQEKPIHTDPVVTYPAGDQIQDAVFTDIKEEPNKNVPPIEDFEELVGNKVFQLISDMKAEKFIEDLDWDKLQEFIEATKDPDFGKKGVYGYYCKYCGGSWSFTNKTTKAFFEKFHRHTGCALGVNTERLMKENRLIVKRSKLNHMSLKATQKITDLVEKRTLKEDETENKIAA